MTPRPSRPARVLASALAVGTLLTTAACSDGESEGSGATTSPAATGKASPSPSATVAAVTQAQAEAALITAADVEDAWTQAQDPKSWHDTLLTGTVDASQFVTDKSAAADCQRLIDGLYRDDLLGKPAGASAVVGFTQNNSRLLQQTAAYDKAELDKSLSWLAGLADKCAQFTVKGSGGDRTVQVVEATLPKAGDARQGLTVSVKGTSNGEPVTLTLDVAASQVGPNAVTVTNGGTEGVSHDSTANAITFGTQHLKDVLAGKTPAPAPSQIE
ncbi:hypothetical protein FNH09_23000 [Streptomyces adustus]|uniref:Lipoprotein n=1 Tax=Streptomyces adustus TaxID=1609272 RepID=A0A5N8VFI4_9ACTN|nr:hypothetical protein [Streptomyces adustus]MPY34007.1 hypothetical protein [Streptomyces adustus]